MPSHRALALFRGRNEGMLRRRAGARAELRDRSRDAPPTPANGMIAARFGSRDQGRAGRRLAARNACAGPGRSSSACTSRRDLFGALRERAEEEAIRVFAHNLRDLLLAAPAGPRVTMGLDPGIRTGVQGGGGRRHRQAARHRHRLPARAAQRLGRRAAHAGRSCADKHGVRPDRHRQRHRLAARPTSWPPS